MTLFRKLAWLFHRRKKEDELREELAFHLEEEGARDLGNVTLVMEDTRAAWSWIWIEQLFQDLRYALRTMLNNKAFTILAALSLALGIGANTAIFSFMDALLMRSLPVRDPQSLAVLNWHARPSESSRDFVMHGMSGSSWAANGGEESGIFPYPAFEHLRANNSAFSTLFAYRPAGNLNFTARGQSDLVKGEYVSGDYFRGLDLAAAAGRLIAPEDDRFEAPAVAVLSDAYGRTRFGEPGNAIGASILIDDIPFTVIGVTPPEFFGVDPGVRPEIFLPMHSNVAVEAANPYGNSAKSYLDQNYYWIEMMGRLRPGVTLQQAQASVAPPFAQWVVPTADTAIQRSNLPVLILKEGAGGLDNLRRHYSKPLYVLMAMVALILAIACANVANLLLARATARRREIALRLSVGAGRMRVIRQLLTESVLLSAISGALGILFAMWGVRFLGALLARGQDQWSPTLQADVNWHVLAVAAALSVLTGVLFGLAPAIQSTRVDLTSALKESNAGAKRHPFFRVGMSHILIAGQIAMSVLMLIGAGLFIRTLSNLSSIDLGFNRENILLFEMNARKAGHQDPELARFYAQLRERFTAIPGVRSASLSISPILEAGHGFPIHEPGKEADRKTRYLTVGPDYFTTMGIPIVAGRGIELRDHAGTGGVVVVSEFFARKNFGDAGPLGRHLLLVGGKKGEERDTVVIGVARNTRYGGLKEETPPVVYIPFDQGYPPPREMTFALRTSGDPLKDANAVREIVRQADSRVPVAELKTQAAEIDEVMGQEIMFAELCSIFALLALAIACVGLYGTMSYNVARRTSEIGIRMALGAPRPRVVWMVLREFLVLAIAGLAISIPIAKFASKNVESFLFRMNVNDPWAISLAVATLLCAALIATLIPARRASRIDPMIALRHE